MIRFCIISTDQNTIDSFLETIKHTLFAINEKEQVKIVPSFTEYEKEEDQIDVLVLDLESNPIKDIKELDIYKHPSLNNDFRMILVSNTSEFAVSAFEYGATGFIVKPVNKSTTETFIQKAIIEIYKSSTTSKIDKPNSIVLKNGNAYERVSLFDIAYIEVTKHDVFYHIYKNGVQDKVIKSRSSLKKEREQLSTSIFVSSGINCLINVRYITKILGDNVYIGDSKIHISRLYKKEILKSFKEYYKR